MLFGALNGLTLGKWDGHKTAFEFGPHIAKEEQLHDTKMCLEALNLVHKGKTSIAAILSAGFTRGKHLTVIGIAGALLGKDLTCRSRA